MDSENNSIEVYLLIEGKFVLDDIYMIYPDYLINKMSDEEKQEIKDELKTALYDDMTIILAEVFNGRF